VLYSSQSNVIIFPADDETRLRRAIRHVQELQPKLDELGWERAWSAGDWAEHTAALGVRLAYVRGALPSIAKAQPARHGNVISHRLSLRLACESLEWLLERAADCLQQLGDPDSSDLVRRDAIEQWQDQRPQLISTLTQLDRLLSSTAS
jgi:hypothetical protein